MPIDVPINIAKFSFILFNIKKNVYWHRIPKISIYNVVIHNLPFKSTPYKNKEICYFKNKK